MPRFLLAPALGAVLFLALLTAWTAHAAPLACRLCLSQVYADGGKNRSLYDADYVEIFNASPDPQPLAGWRLDYAAMHSSDWKAVSLDSLTLPPYTYALVRLKAGAGAASLPPADAEGNLNLTSDGKLRLVDPDNVQVDLLGYGDADWAEGDPAPRIPDNTVLLRRQGGCQDGDDNSADFEIGSPSPRNSQSPANSCTGALTPIPDTATPLPTFSPTAIELPSATATPIPPEPTQTATATPLPTSTDTSTPTLTPTPFPVATPTLPPASPWAPTATPTTIAIDTPTAIPSLPPTGTLQAEVLTATLQPTALSAATPSLTPSLTPTPTDTLADTPTPAVTPPPLATSTGMATGMATETATETATASPGPTPLGPHTLTPTGTATMTPSPTPTSSPTAEGLPTSTPGPTPLLGELPTATPVPTAGPCTATPDASIIPTPPLPILWFPGATPSPLQIDELAYDGSDAEYIVLANVGQSALSLSGWLVGDAERPGDGEGIYALPDRVLPPGTLFCIARQADAFRSRFGRDPDATIEESAAPVYRLPRKREMAHGELALDDGGDEVVLLTPNLALADVAAYGRAEYALLQLWGELRTQPGDSLQRVPGIAYPSTPDLRLRFLSGPPRPFETRGLPLGDPPIPPTLPGGYLGLWGTLGARSSYSAPSSAPPHFVLAAAAVQGLHFAAIADDGIWAPPLSAPQGFVALPAWRWQGDGGAEAIVYDDRPSGGLSAGALASHLAETNAPVQWLGEGRPPLRGVAAIAADDSSSESIAEIFALWRTAGAPLLPAGNAQPNLPGAVTVAPRYTGLAAASLTVSSLYEAISAGRGWISSDQDTWLTLQAELPSGELRWMGNWLAPANSVTLHISYGDLGGEVAGLAIWQNGAPLQQLLLPPSDGRWAIAVPAMPGAILAAVAIQPDGDFITTAPLMVEQAESGPVQINEVLPAPQQDLDGDGRAGSSDEYVELWNPGAQPIALEGWQLVDRAGESDGGHRFTFAPHALILGGEHLVLWHSKTRLNLGDEGDTLRLLDAEGREHDAVAWDESLAPGRSAARIPDGGAWLPGAAVTPGQPNHAANDQADAPGSDSGSDPDSGSGDDSGGKPGGDTDKQHGDHDGPPAPPILEPTYGQAGGPPGSLAQAKLAGLEARVEVEAIVTVPPGLFNNSIYVADIAGDGQTAGIGANVYLSQGDFPPLVEGDHVRLRGRWHSFRGEMELLVEGPQDVWKLQDGHPLAPLPVWTHTVCESVEGRLVTFDGLVSGWQGDSLLLVDPAHPASAPLRVTVRSSLSWKRPYVHKGEIWHVTGVVSQFARKRPWNDGYRVLVRYPQDLVRIDPLMGR